MPGKQEKSVYVVRFSRMSVNDSWEWTFTSRKAAELTMRRVQANPRNLHAHIIERELMARAPKADVVSAEIGLDGVVTNPAGPFAEREERTTATLELVRLWDKHLLYTGPGTSKKQAALDANQTRKKLADMGLWPREQDMKALILGYEQLPWWLTRPPEPAATDMPKAFYGLALCPDCSQQMVETEGEGELLYSCPQGATGKNPDCRSKALPAGEARSRIISILMERFTRNEDHLKLCRQLQGNSQDPDYHRSLAQELLDTDAEIHQQIREGNYHESLQKDLNETEEERTSIREAVTDCLKDGADPLIALEPFVRSGGRHADVEMSRYLRKLLMRHDSEGSPKWTKDHVRCAEVVPEHEIVHYRDITEEGKLIWEKADSQSHINRILNRT